MAIDWHSMWVPTVSLIELVLRTSVIYLALLALLRISRRDMGALSTADVLVIVLVADAAQNAMAAEYRSVTEGLTIVLTIFGWNFLLDWAAFRFPVVHRLLFPPSILLIRNGRVLRQNLRREQLTEDDLWTHLRQNGVESLSQVKACRLEPDGRFSLLKRSDRG